MAKENFLWYFISVGIILSFYHVEAAPENYLVRQLPGFNGTFPSNHYAGYMNIEGKNLFYYFVVSEGIPTKDPVVLWLNGGPGCSSFDGFIYEHGPFNFEEGKPKGSMPKLHLNPYSWTKVSSIIYLDSPAGVGFSYSKDINKYVTGDIQTATDTHNFLLQWFRQYPEFVSNPFYIAGESYAGIYVPMLASEVVKGIKAGAQPTINFKGYLVGNGVCDQQFDGNALVPFARGMLLISDDIFEETKAACRGNYYANDNLGCSESLNKVEKALIGLNVYNTLEPCYHGQALQTKYTNTSVNVPASFKELGKTDRALPVRKRMFGRAWPLRAPVRDGRVPLWPELLEHMQIPCLNTEVAVTWLNNAAVRKAIHAAPEEVSGPWDVCTDRIQYMHEAGSMLPYHKNLTMMGYRALIYSGDHDMCVPFTGTEAWTRSLGYKIVDEWRSWHSNGQVAGYLQAYEHKLTFLTIKGSGHTVPEYKPREALDFYYRWLEGNPI